MRAIFVGIEYAGKSTLIQLLDSYYRKRKLHTHPDDHFSIPDISLSHESRALAVNFPDDVKERTQRMQIHYHIDIIKDYEHAMMGGWHIEEAVYTSMYGGDPDSTYYSNYIYRAQRSYETQVLAAGLPDVVLIHVTASDATIRDRMRIAPHEYQVIKEKDIAEIKRRFDEEVEKSLFSQLTPMIVLDTTDKTSSQSFDELLTRTEPWITTAELAVRALPIPEGDYEVRYENGVRKMIPA